MDPRDENERLSEPWLARTKPSPSLPEDDDPETPPPPAPLSPPPTPDRSAASWFTPKVFTHTEILFSAS